ncbi:MAG: hypothetical protein ABIK83_14655 [Candidatus Zixiibacteriota bacterium]
MKRTIALVLLVAIVSLWIVAVSHAAVPQMINYQGRLTGPDGTPIDATVSITFTIWDQLTDGASYWTETHASVLVTDGLFNVILGGSTEPIDDSVFVDPDRYLGIAVNGDPEIEPRTRLISVPFAYRSVKSDTADYVAGGIGDADWVIDGDNVYRETGNVGIGTNSPDLKLTVRDGSQTLQALFGQGRTSGHSAIGFGEDDANDKVFLIGYDHDNNFGFMRIGGDPVSARVIVADGGNVGIGSTNPTTKLEVAGTVQMWGFLMPTSATNGHVLTSDANGNGTWQPAGNLGGSGTINYVPKFTAASTLGNTGIYETDGKVNIGNGSPNETRLNVSGTSPQITIRDSGIGVNQKIGVDGNGLSLYYDSGASLTVNRNNGNVGIGTTSPTGTVHIEAAGGDMLLINATQVGGSGPRIGLYNPDNGYSTRIQAKDGTLLAIEEGSTERFRIAEGGNVGIGTASPGYKLDVDGDLFVRGTTGGGIKAYRLEVANASWGAGGPSTLTVTNNNAYNANPVVTFEQQHSSAVTPVLIVTQGGNSNAITCSSPSVLNAGAAMYGEATSASGGGVGVYGRTHGPGANDGAAMGVYGYSLATTTGNSAADSGGTFGVLGRAKALYGGIGQPPAGVFGWGERTEGLIHGVWGETISSTNGSCGVHGKAVSGSGKTWGVYGSTKSTSTGAAGVYGLAEKNSGVTYGVYGETKSPSGYAGYFQGNVHVTGTITKGGGGFKIDHPLDPQNQWLYHSFVESPDMKNIYDGTLITDGEGTAVVELPDYFTELNSDFRYQLTVIGEFAQAIVSKEIENNRFEIRTNKSNVKVSWQVTGVRRDPFAAANRIEVEVEKSAEEKGTYFHSEEYGVANER